MAEGGDMVDKIIQIAANKYGVCGLSENGKLYKVAHNMGTEWRLILTSEDEDKYEDVK